MRVVALLVVLFSIASVSAQERSRVRGRALVDVMECTGGAAATGPPGSRAEAYVGEVTFRRGRHNRGRAVARTTTNERGRFSVSLPPGTYCVGIAERALPDPSEGGMGLSGTGGSGAAMGTTDTACLDELRAGCDAIVTVPHEGTITVRTTQPCFGPCYSGPLPG